MSLDLQARQDQLARAVVAQQARVDRLAQRVHLDRVRLAQREAELRALQVLLDAARQVLQDQQVQLALQAPSVSEPKDQLVLQDRVSQVRQAHPADPLAQPGLLEAEARLASQDQPDRPAGQAPRVRLAKDPLEFRDPQGRRAPWDRLV